MCYLRFKEGFASTSRPGWHRVWFAQENALTCQGLLRVGSIRTWMPFLSMTRAPFAAQFDLIGLSTPMPERRSEFRASAKTAFECQVRIPKLLPE